MFGYVKIGAAVPQLKLADCISNKEEILKLIREANEKGIRVLTFPELALTGYTCGDLFFQLPLIQAAEQALKEIAAETAELDMVIAIGVPVMADNQTFNCVALVWFPKPLFLTTANFMKNVGLHLQAISSVRKSPTQVRWFPLAQICSLQPTAFLS